MKKEFQEGDIIRFDGPEGDYAIVMWNYEENQIGYRLWSDFDNNPQFSYDFNLKDMDFDVIEKVGTFKEFIK